MDIASILLGAAVGSAVTLAWEGFAKPRIVGRSLAELLAADLSLQMQNVVAEHAQFQADPKTLPLRRPMQTQVFNALIPRLGELPTDVLPGVIGTYRVIERLNDIGAIAQEAWASFQREGNAPHATAKEKELAHALAMYRRFLVDALRRIGEIQPLVLRAARPRWSVRSWFAERPEQLDASSLAQRTLELRQETKREAARIRGEGAEDGD